MPRTAGSIVYCCTTCQLCPIVYDVHIHIYHMIPAHTSTRLFPFFRSTAVVQQCTTVRAKIMRFRTRLDEGGSNAALFFRHPHPFGCGVTEVWKPVQGSVPWGYLVRPMISSVHILYVYVHRRTASTCWTSTCTRRPWKPRHFPRKYPRRCGCRHCGRGSSKGRSPRSRPRA